MFWYFVCSPISSMGHHTTPSKRILLVEDSQAQSELLEQALAHHGWSGSAQVVRDGAFALATLLNATSSDRLPDLVLIDIKLKSESGINLVHRLRADPRLAMLPVVMFTTSDDPNDILTAYAAGANGYVVKPDTFEELTVMARDLCGYWLKWNRLPSRRVSTQLDQK